MLGESDTIGHRMSTSLEKSTSEQVAPKERRLLTVGLLGLLMFLKILPTQVCSAHEGRGSWPWCRQHLALLLLLLLREGTLQAWQHP